MTELASWSDLLVQVGLCGMRPAVACLLLPILAPEAVPPMVRNGLFMALGALALAMQPAASPAIGTDGLGWLLAAVREASLGLVLGFGLAGFLWAFVAAGDIVDAKVSLAAGSIHDLGSGTSSGPSGALLGRLCACMFMAGGGLGAFVRVLVDSFRIWPIGRWAWQPSPAGLAVVEAWFADGSALALMLAAPVIVVLFAIDLVLGLINRCAPQIPLIGLSASLKACAAVAAWWLMLGVLAQGFDKALFEGLMGLLPGVGRAWMGLG